MQNLLIVSCLAVATLAAPEADAHYGYGYQSLAATWPSTRGYGFQSTCYGCRGHYIGKREADASYSGYGYGVPAISVYGRPLGSGYAISQIHPSGRSFQQINRVHGYYGYGKREAEAEAKPEADAYYGYGYGHGYGHGPGHGGYSGHGYGHGHGLGHGHGGYSGHGYSLGQGHGLGYLHGGYSVHGYGHGYGYGYYG